MGPWLPCRIPGFPITFDANPMRPPAKQGGPRRMPRPSGLQASWRCFYGLLSTSGVEASPSVFCTKALTVTVGGAPSLEKIFVFPFIPYAYTL